MNSIFSRTSIRNFLAKDVEEEKLTMILKAAMAAPSAGNQQPWEFYVIKDKKVLADLAACSPYSGCVAGAPVAIVPCYRTKCMFPENAQMDLSAATENMLLAANELNLGSVWLGIAPLQERMDKVRKVLSIPVGMEAFAILPIGYPVKVSPQENRFDEARIHTIG